MKKMLFSLSTFALLTILSGCEKEADSPSGLDTEGGLLALIEPDTRTKTNYDSFEGKFVWSEGDQLALHYNDGSYKEVAVNASTGSVDAPSPSSRNLYAVYPASVADPANFGSPTLKITLPDSYDISGIVAGSKTSDFSPCPMVASNSADTDILNFYHVGGLLRVTLKDLPVLTQKIRVTFDSDVTGTYEVSNPGTMNPTINTRGESANNVVTFTLAADAIGIYAGEIVLNIPVPCGKYSSIYFEALNTSEASIADKTYNTRPLTFVRHHGKKMNFGGEGLEPFVELELNFYEKTAWAGENNLLIAVPYSAGSPITGGTYTVTEEVLQGSETALELLPLQQGEAHGSIVLFSSPRNDGVSKKITVTFEKGEVRLSASAIYHVNNITGISLDKTYRQYAWPGHTRTLTAEVKHTGYGDIEGLLSKNPLQVQWSSDKTDLAIPQKSSTVSREQNILYAKPNDNPVVTPELTISTITAHIPENNWGANEPYSITTTFRVVPFTAVPGGFTGKHGITEFGDIPSREFVLSRGCVVVTDHLQGSTHNISWKFADHQWEFFDNAPPTQSGETSTYSFFCWGTGDKPWYIYPPDTWLIPGPSTWLSPDQISFVDWGIHFDEQGLGSDSFTNGKWHTPWGNPNSQRVTPPTSPDSHLGINGNRVGSGYFFARISGNGVNAFGKVFTPDHWVRPEGVNAPAGPVFSLSVYEYSLEEWSKLEESGVFFLPFNHKVELVSGRAYWPSHYDECTNLSDWGGYYWHSNTSAWADYKYGGTFWVLLQCNHLSLVSQRAVLDHRAGVFLAHE